MSKEREIFSFVVGSKRKTFYLKTKLKDKSCCQTSNRRKCFFKIIKENCKKKVERFLFCSLEHDEEK